MMVPQSELNKLNGLVQHQTMPPTCYASRVALGVGAPAIKSVLTPKLDSHQRERNHARYRPRAPE